MYKARVYTDGLTAKLWGVFDSEKEDFVRDNFGYVFTTPFRNYALMASKLLKSSNEGGVNEYKRKAN